MPSVRLAASRTTANASVLPRSSSSLSFSNSGSSALMRLTLLESWRNTRSLRLPNRLVRARLNIDLPGWSEMPTAHAGQSSMLLHARRAPPMRQQHRAQPAKPSRGALLNGAGQRRIQGMAGNRLGSAMVAHERQRNDHAAVVPD